MEKWSFASSVKRINHYSSIIFHSSYCPDIQSTVPNRRTTPMFRLITLALASTLLIALVSIQAAELDPKAINIQLPKDIKWTGTPGGSQQAVVQGDPSKPGLYIV